MPIYEFVCPNNHVTEVMLGFDEEHPTYCDECGEELRKVYSAPAVRLRGPGFYLTDNNKISKPIGGLNYEPRSGT